MSRIPFWTLVLGSLCLSPLSAVSRAAAQIPPPNVVLITADDLGYSDLGSYGADDVRTPNIDGIGRDGVRLTDFYASASTCTATRAALITGRYQQRIGFEGPLPARSERGLPASKHSLPHLMGEAGYATALVGKWHLGFLPQFSPLAHGYDHHFGTKAAFADYWEHTSGADRHDLWENDEPVHRDGHLTDLITGESVAWIDRNAGRPFFIHVSYTAPHMGGGLHDRGEYIAAVEQMDRGVGEILEALERHGLTERTLVIFTNDNGGGPLSRNYPLFHRKRTVWEGGVRVPAVVRWPDRIPPGRVSDQVGITMDLTASVLAAAGVAVPPDARPDGLDLLPILEGRSPEVERTLFWRTADGSQAAVRRGGWKVMGDAISGGVLLFDLRADPGERDDRYYRQPELAEELATLLRAWVREVDEEAGTGER